MCNSDLKEVIKSAQNGDVKAFEQIYDEYAKATYFIAFKLLQNQQNAEEVTQDVFIYVYKKISDLKYPQAFTVWINKITANKCTDFLRKNNPFTVDIDEIAESEFVEEYDPKLIPEKSLDNEATAQIIIEIIDNLPLPQRVCVYYYYYEHLTVKEIAEQLEIKETTVKNRLALARDKIRKELEKLEDKDGIKLYSVFPLFLIPLLKAAAESSELPQGILSRILPEIGAGATASATGPATAADAKAGLGLKAITSIAAAVVIAGGVITAVVALNTSPETVETVADNSKTTISATAKDSNDNEIKNVEMWVPVKETYKYVDAANSDRDHVVVIKHNEKGKMIERGLTFNNPDNNQIITYEYDENGKMIKESITHANGQADYFLIYEYDKNGRPIGWLRNNDIRTTYEYDENGNRIKSVTSSGDYQTYEYDQNGRLIKETSSYGKTTEYEYFSDGKRKSRRDTDKDGTTFYLEWEYDSEGRIVKYPMLGGFYEIYEYDEKGCNTKRTNYNPDGTISCYVTIEYEKITVKAP